MSSHDYNRNWLRTLPYQSCKAENLCKSRNYIVTSLAFPGFNPGISTAHCGDPRCGLQCSALKPTCLQGRDVPSPSLSPKAAALEAAQTFLPGNVPSPCPFPHRCNGLQASLCLLDVFPKPGHLFKIWHEAGHLIQHLPHIDVFTLHWRFVHTPNLPFPPNTSTPSTHFRSCNLR